MKTLQLTVTQFNSFVKKIFDAEEFLQSIAIVGEVTNFKISGGNAFFELKDSEAMISCVKFGADDFNIKNGDKILAFGKVNFYVKSGRLSFLVRSIELFGQGNLYQQFLILKEKLEKEGYFRAEIKKNIPSFAKKVGVVTSETGAVIHDIMSVTKSKNPFTDIIIFPSKVQGVGAENDIEKGIAYFNSRDDIDVIIVARGGGSLEDLAPFNTEKVVKAIFNSNIPIISAVGHETDFTLCDFAADLRVPTPSVAAEVAVFDYYEQIRNIQKLNQQSLLSVQRKISEQKNNLALVSESVADKIKLKISGDFAELSSFIKNINLLIDKILNNRKNDTNQISNIISKMNPLEILKNGYAVIESDEKKISSVSDIDIGSKVQITFHDGQATAEITEKNAKL